MSMRLWSFLIALVCVAAACQGQSREKMMLQGDQLVNEGNQKGAVVVYKNLLEKYPGDVPASLALADAYLSLGKPAQAEGELKGLLEKDGGKGNKDVSVLLARIRISDGKPADALDILKPLLDSTPPIPAALEQAGHACLLLGDLKEAQAFYQQALIANPALIKARLGLADVYAQTRQPAKAREEIESLLKAAPKDKTALLMLAQLQALANEEDALLETYGLLSKYYPGDVAVVYREAFLRLTKRNDVDYAQNVAARLVKDAPKSPEGYKLQGVAFLARNESGMAADPLHKALKIRPDLDTNIFLAQAYANMGHLETAVSHLQAALAKNPDLDGPRRMLASIFLRQNRLDEAIAETQKLFAKSPSDEGGQRILADALVAKREYDKGLEVFTRLAEKEGQSPTVYLKKGMLLAVKGEDKAAEADLRKAVDLDGKALEPRLYLASFLASKNRVDDAVEVLGAGLTEGPGAALACNAMAKLRLRQGRLDQAMELLEKGKTTDPAVLTTYYNLAAIHTASGAMDKAALDFEAALAVKPDDMRSLLGAAGCREALGELDKARTWLERAAAGKTPQASLALAEFFVRRSDNAKALDVLDNALTGSPKEIQLWLFKSRLHAAMGDQEKTLSALGRAETINQGVGLLEKAKYYMSRKDTAAAIETAGKLVNMNPASGDYYLPLAEIQELAEQADAAEATLNKALMADPGNAKALTALARLDSRRGKADKALAHMDKAIAAGMDPSNAYALKGAILQQTGDTAKAATEYEKALRYQDRNPLALNNLAMIYADQQGGSAKALDLAMRAYSLESNNPSVLDTLGYALLKSGRFSEALAALERAEKLGPGNEEIAKHLALARESAAAKKQ